MPKSSTLGKSLMKQKKRKNQHFTDKHTTDIHGDTDFAKLPVRSITEQNSLDEFFMIADLSQKDFSAVKKNIRFITKETFEGVLQPSAVKRADELHDELQKDLVVPRRPKWSREMTKDELHQLEKATYLHWRAQLARLEATDGVTLTPFEKNLDFWRELWRVVEQSDIVVQIVDARRPLLYYNCDLDAYVNELSLSKSCVLLVNKADLLTAEQRAEWAAHFSKASIKAIFWSAKTQKSTNLHTIEEGDEVKGVYESLPAESSEALDQRKPSDLVNCEELLGFFKSLDCKENRHNPRHLTVGFIGYPNVGKSSTLNALVGRKRVSVSATPGHTKRLQTIQLEEGLVLCDCPGMVLPSFVYTRADLVVSGILSADENPDFVGPVNIICRQIPRHVLEAVYGVIIKKPPLTDDPNRPPTAYEFLGAIAYMRGFMTAKGVPHYDRAARLVLKDYVNGRLLYCHPPPGMTEEQYVALGDQASAFAPQLADKVASGARQASVASSDQNELIEKFDRVMLGQEKSFGRRLDGGFRTKRHVPTVEASREDGDEGSMASWTTVDSRASTVGGASLLSGVAYSTYSRGGASAFDADDASSITGKQAWRRLSESKKGYYSVTSDMDNKGTARPRKRKEKLRKVYADLDRHDM